MQLIVAEKPSVARDLARVLGVPQSGAGGRGWFGGDGGEGGAGGGRIITWCIGHLVELEEPAAYDGRWKAWRLDTLPMLPTEFQLRPTKSSAAQYRVVARLLGDRRVTEVVNACDAGREGELIFRYLYQLARCRLPVRRLWISSLTDDAVRAGFAALRPGRSLDALADAARCRSEADWLVGMNATRALTLRRRTGGDSPLLSIGRVQTPTLAMLVHRERAIRDFRPDDYFEVRAQLSTVRGGPAQPGGERFGALFSFRGATRFGVAEHAQAVEQRDNDCGAADDEGGPVVEALRARNTREPPPLLFDLTSLQRTANRRYGLSAARTLAIAQALYEKHKVLTYPRTDSRHLTSDVARELAKPFRALAALPAYQRFAQELIDHPPRPGRRIVDDTRVQDHHAIIPTGKPIDMERLDRDEQRVLDLVARRFLGAFFPDAEFAITDVVVRVGPGAPTERRPDGDGESDGGGSGGGGGGAELPPESEGAGASKAAEEDKARRRITALPPTPDRYLARGKVRLVAGWQEVAGIDPASSAKEGRSRGAGRAGPEGADSADGDGDEAVAALPRLAVGQRLEGEFGVLAKKTQPPPRYTEATLLAAMESAGRAIEDEAMRQAMKDTGLGTPATRAAIIETLLDRGYIERVKKALVPTPMGMDLVETLPAPSLASAELTGSWEARLVRVARGEERRDQFMADIRAFVTDVVAAIRGAHVAPIHGVRVAPPRETSTRRPRREAASPTPAPAPAPARAPGRRPAPTAPAPARRPAPTPVRRPAPAPARRPSPAPARRAALAPPARTTAPRAASPSLTCPRCRLGALITGKRGWGCSRWREGCRFVVWFESAGKRLTDKMLEELVTKGKTRTSSYRPDGLAPVEGRLVLDVAGEGPAGGVRFVPATRTRRGN